MEIIKGKLCKLIVLNEGSIYWRNNEGYDEFIHPDDYKLIIDTLSEPIQNNTHQDISRASGEMPTKKTNVGGMKLSTNIPDGTFNHEITHQEDINEKDQITR